MWMKFRVSTLGEKQIPDDYLNSDNISEKLKNKHNQIFRDTSETHWNNNVDYYNDDESFRDKALLGISQDNG